MSQTTKRVFTHKSKLFLILVSIIIFISCKGQYFPDSEGDSGGAGGGSAGGNIVGKDYKLPKGSLSQEEQKKDMDPNKYTTTLYKLGDYGSQYFRIPALICTSNGTILAAADRRYDNPADLGKDKTKIDVLVRRSEDLGATWSEPIVVAGVATDYASSYGDAFFINCHNGDVLCGFIKEPGIQQNGKGETVIYRSKDDGKTWTRQYSFLPTTINNANKGLGASGQGLTLRHGANAGAKKLMFAYTQWNKNGGLSVTAMVSSDDGATFSSVGNIKTPEKIINEAKAIELSDGTIMLNYGRGVNPGGRAWSKSTDGGRNWTYQGVDGEVLDPGNNADFTRYEFNGKYIKTDKYILMINANVNADGKWFFTRKNHHIRLTENEFKNGNGTATGKYTYDKQLVIGGEKLFSGYPAITTLPDGTICTLTEETSKTTRPPEVTLDAGGDDYNIVFRRFNLYWLSDGKEYVDYNTDNLFQYKNY
ncbi:sialidase family protein [Brachyspira aalborgi]|uniref:exo-alpha-sialidase n=1 Tax=Brachyspira aalborgi TaxID=29522 RepID=A0A5C8EWH0_9SPIR|nr:sialidase family protein [Brachyspira aalborgi]TXJ41414.1 exo-alpha-sialidase [Brachyspira aalborgi]